MYKSVACVLFLGLSTAALADDGLDSLRGTTAPDWSGVYAGVGLGYGKVWDHTGVVSDSGEDMVFSGFIGYNHQYNDSLVVGVEAEYNDYSIEFTKFAPISVEDGASLRLRLGFPTDRALIYATGGLAYATTNIDQEDFGYVIGAGVDFKLTDNVVFGVNYLHSQYYNFDDSGIDAKVDTVRARLSYLFN